ncbi:MAG: hypothetical protein II970_04090, partial [Paludibacteraceae bacterium]|nr:hypothetical protein [Paludibacteraceae bacterium]
MKKLFSIFCYLLLSASIVTQAQLLDALNESPLRDANLVDASLQVVSGEINLSDDNGEYYIIEKNGSRKAPAATTKSIMVNSTPQYVNVQKTSTTNCYNVYIKTSYNSSVYTGFVIMGTNFGSNTAIGGEHSFSSSYSNCTESDNWFCQAYGSPQTYVDNPYGKIKFTYSSMGSDGYPKYRVQIYNCYGYTYNSTYGCVNWKNNSIVFSFDQTLSVHPFASDGSTRIDFTDYYKLTVVSDNSSMGSVSGDGSASGGQYYGAGTSHTNLTASPNSSAFNFVKWQKNGADFSGNTANPLSVTLNANDTYTAIFEANAATEYTISTAVSPSGTYGSVSGAGKYYENSTATLTATSANEHLYFFDHWLKDGNNYVGGATITPTVTAAATYTAVFRNANAGTITANANNANYGTVTGGGSYNGGDAVTLTATPSYDYQFIKWNDGNTSSTRTVYVDGNATY